MKLRDQIIDNFAYNDGSSFAAELYAGGFRSSDETEALVREARLSHQIENDTDTVPTIFFEHPSFARGLHDALMLEAVSRGSKL